LSSCLSLILCKFLVGASRFDLHPFPMATGLLHSSETYVFTCNNRYS
jgi:hypothetical protein